MQIRQMFQKDINRAINGVIKVTQDDDDAIRQEVDEYVITDELQKHFQTLFEAYSKAFSHPTGDIGVWIAGFFGSGKSHFLKILSYLLDSELSAKYHVRESFHEKFATAPDIQKLLAASTQGETNTILFNIDIEGSIDKNPTAVLRVFAKMFYNFLGYYGEDLQTARLEQFLQQKGMLDTFKEAFEEEMGDSWEDSRDAFAFYEDEVVAAMTKSLGMSETAARDWFNGSSKQDMSIAQLVREIKAFVDTKPEDYRLIFMIDEVGQYVGTNTDMLLNLQSIIEELGAKCGGKVWVFATGQEALDEIIKVRQNEFSRIMARFKTRLSLSSSSVDEVIQRRVLAKTDEANEVLKQVYTDNAASLANLFTFQKAKSDLRAYQDVEEFQTNYPFIPYQFTLLQKVFEKVRKHGNAGKHLSGGERSMLSSFQEAAQKVQDESEMALVPFYRFYDTMNTFLDGSIRRVIDRCEKAAKHHEGLQAFDVSVLKCLYLIRYTEDEMPANADNVMMLMADHIGMDKLDARHAVEDSLDRLLTQNYVGRTGDVFQFLTDEEQEMQDDIRSMDIEPSQITEHIGRLIFSDIYPDSKYHYRIYDFPFNKKIDGAILGHTVTNGMTLEFLTDASEVSTISEMTLIGQSKGEAIVVLSTESRYYDLIEESMKIRKYIDQYASKEYSNEMAGLIAMQEQKATRLEGRALEDIADAIKHGQFYVDGEHLPLKAGEATTRIHQSLEYLVKQVYRKLDFITKPVDSEEDIRAILQGNRLQDLGGELVNAEAVKDMTMYLRIRDEQKRRTTMSDVQSHFQDVPYGWREIDVAAVTAMLLVGQQVVLKYAGETIRPTDPRVIAMLRKRSEIGRTVIAKRQQIDQNQLREVSEFLEDYLDTMNIPQEQSKLVDFIIEKFTEKQVRYAEWLKNYRHIPYPDHSTLARAKGLLDRVLAKKQDEFAIINELAGNIPAFDYLLDSLINVEAFFDNQRPLFDEAVYFLNAMEKDMDYFQDQEEIVTRVNEIRAILQVRDGESYDYTQIPKLRTLMDAVQKAHQKLLAEVRESQNAVVTKCMEDIYAAAGDAPYVRETVARYSDYYKDQRQKFDRVTSVVELNGMKEMLYDQRDRAVNSIQSAIRHHNAPKPADVEKTNQKMVTPPQQNIVRTIERRGLFPVQEFTSEAEIDAYLRRVGNELKAALKKANRIRLR